MVFLLDVSPCECVRVLCAFNVKIVAVQLDSVRFKSVSTTNKITIIIMPCIHLFESSGPFLLYTEIKWDRLRSICGWKIFERLN